MLIPLTERHSNQYEHISEMGFASRTTGNRSTALMSALLNLGNELLSPLENGLQASTKTVLPKYAADLKVCVFNALHDARENLNAARMEQAAQYDQRYRHLECKVWTWSSEEPIF